MKSAMVIAPLALAVVLGSPAGLADEPFFLGLGDLPGQLYYSKAYGVSADGSVVVGNGDPGYSNGGAFRWTEETGMVNLGFIPGQSLYSGAAAVSGDGSIVVGSTQDRVGPAFAFIWDGEHGMRGLQDLLEQHYGLDLTGWWLRSAKGISADGLTIVGYGDHHGFGTEGWIAHIPEPSTLSLLALGALALGCQTRRDR
ncbi:MAG TPA: PEP-CTERM sorting domain-containing protein [Phycisphaerae bacterium]|nr:PEP-CTERM sorting domain-containing protein [Phycisphaerae bacterium]